MHLKNEEMEKINKIYYDSVKGLNHNILNNASMWYNFVNKLPIDQQIVYTTITFHTQIENGGFHQYFFNSYGQFAYLTLKNLKLITAFKRSNLLDKAIKYVNYENLNINLFREAVFNKEIKLLTEFDVSLFNNLDNLDNEYYAIKDEDIYDLLNIYINVFYSISN